MRIGLTEAGWALVLLATAMACVGFYSELNLLYLLASSSFALVALSVFCAVCALRGLDIERHLPREVSAELGGRVRVKLFLRRRVLWPFGRFTLEEEYRCGDVKVSHFCFFERSPRRGPVNARYTLFLPRRGEYQLAPPWLESSFPFGLAYVRRRLRRRRDSLVVFPRRGQLRRRPRLAARPGPAPERAAARMEPEGEFRSLREYQPGDNPHLIHWRVSAKQQKLQLRELEQRTAFQSVTLIVGARQPRRPSSEDLRRVEQAVSFAATLAVQWLAEGHSVSVISAGGETPYTASRRILLKHLAVLPATETHDDLMSVLDRALQERELRPAVLVSSDRGTLAAVLSRMPASPLPAYAAGTREFERVFELQAVSPPGRS